MPVYLLRVRESNTDGFVWNAEEVRTVTNRVWSEQSGSNCRRRRLFIRSNGPSNLHFPTIIISTLRMMRSGKSLARKK